MVKRKFNLKKIISKMRTIDVIINKDGVVNYTKKELQEFEHEATILKCVCDVAYKNFNKYIDFDINNLKFRSANLTNNSADFNFKLPQNFCTGTLKLQFVFINNVDIIFKSQTLIFKFNKSINAINSITTEHGDILNDFENRISVLEAAKTVIINSLNTEISEREQEDLLLQQDINNRILISEKGVAGGVAPLNFAGQIAAQYLPSFVDDVIEGYYVNSTEFYKDEEHTELIVGERGKIYLSLDTNRAYRFTGTQFMQIINELPPDYEYVLLSKHTHSNKSVLDLITEAFTTTLKQSYDIAAAKAHEHNNLTVINTIEQTWKNAVDDVIARLAAKWLGTDIALNQIGITHLTTALQQLIGSNNNITNYPDNLTLISYVENSINKLGIKDLGINPFTKIQWQWGGIMKGVNLDGVDDCIVVLNNESLNPEINGVLQGFSIEIVGDFSQHRTAPRWLIGRGSSGGGLGYSFLYNYAINNYQFTITTAGGEELYQISNSLVPTTTRTVVITIDWLNSKVRFYVDGQFKQENNITKTGTIAVAYALCIGGYKNNNTLTGAFASSCSRTPLYVYRQYNKVLSKSEVLQLWNNGRPDLVTLPFYLTGSRIAELSTGLLTVGKMYKITARTTSDFTTVGAVNNNVNTEFIATGTGAGLLDANNKVTRVGNVLEFLGENIGHITAIDSSGNYYHGFCFGNPAKLELPFIQKAWTGNFTTNIAVGVANRDITIPAGYMVEMITVRNTLVSGNITNFKAVLNPASDNDTLISDKTINNGKTRKFQQLGDCVVDNINNMTLRFNCTGNGAGGIDIMVLLRRKD